jgi:hypothetical protein
MIEQITSMGCNVAVRCDGRDRLYASSSTRKKASMDREEAERLARAIRKVTADWIQVQGVEFNAATGTYELTCLYRQTRKGLFHQESWVTLQITSPRQWIDLLIKHRDDLELP